MARPQGPPTYLKHEVSGKIYARTKLFGKYVSLGAYNSDESLRRFEEIRAQWRATMERGAPRARRGVLTVALLADTWLRHIEDQGMYTRADGSTTSELSSWRLSLVPLLRLYASEPAAEFSPKKLKALRAAMCSGSWLRAEEKASRKPCEVQWCRRTVNQRVARIVRMFAHGVSEELLPVAIHQALLTVEPLPAGKAARDYAPVGPVPAQDIRDTLPLLGPIPKAIALVQLATGMRPGEVCRMDRRDIDTQGVQVEGRTIWVYRPGRHKTAKHVKRAIPLGPAAQLALAPWLGATRWVFASARDSTKPYQLSHYSDQVTAAALAAGVPPWSPGRLRKVAATDLQERLGIEAARATLGHTDKAVTLAHYARGDLTIAARGAARFG